MPDDSDFYIGYHPTAPANTGRFGRRVILVLLGMGVLLSLLLAGRQSRADASYFEFGIESRLEGRIVEHPYPTLLLARPGTTERAAAYSRYYLVAPGKHGAQDKVHGLDGQNVGLVGSLIYRDGQTMLEVARTEPGQSTYSREHRHHGTRPFHPAGRDRRLEVLPRRHAAG